MINQSPLNVQSIAMRRKQEDAINSERRYGHVELFTLECYKMNAAWNLIKYSFTQTVNIPELIRVEWLNLRNEETRQCFYFLFFLRAVF